MLRKRNIISIILFWIILIVLYEMISKMCIRDSICTQPMSTKKMSCHLNMDGNMKEWVGMHRQVVHRCIGCTIPVSYTHLFRERIDLWLLYANLLLNVLYHIEIEMKIRESCLQKMCIRDSLKADKDNWLK